jgi:thioredoxin-like negative regulator of GroEL
MAHEPNRVRRRRRVRSARPHRQKNLGSRIAIYFLALGVGALLGFLCLTYIPRAYANWRESRLLKQASEFLEKEDYPQATRAAQQMLRSRPDSVAALHIMADATERQNSSETVTWRAQIARAIPQSVDAHLNLASAALRFGQLDVARRALDNVPQEHRDDAAYHVVAGWLARAQGDEAGTENHFAAAVAKEPENDLYHFNLAVLRIRSSDPDKAAAARETLERLRKVSAFRTGSLRALLSDAVDNDELERADQLAQDLQMSQQVTFGDYLLALDFYRKLDEKKFEALLEKVKPVAARQPPDVAMLMEWMNRNGLATEVLKWTDKLPPEFTTVPPPAITVAEAFAEMKNWSRLRRWTRGGAWGDQEYLRLAYQSYAARQARQSASDAESDALWLSAERAASEHPEREAALARLASKWGLSAEAKVLWKRVARHPPMRREALDALFLIHRANNDLPELLQVSKQLHDSSPRETLLTSNFARFALLLSPNTEEAQRKAKEAFDKAPMDVNAAVTHAFALYSAGRSAEGLEILRRFPSEKLDDSHTAVYMAVLLLDEEQIEEAQNYIAAARKGPLYPEEKKLLDEAVAKSAPPAADSSSPAQSATPPPEPTSSESPAPDAPAPETPASPPPPA